MANLSKKRYLETIRHNLRTPDGTKLDSVFIIAGPSHPARTSHEDRSYVKLARQSNRAGKLALSEDADEKRQDHVEEMAAAVLGWEKVDLGDGDVPFSKDAVRKLLGDPDYRWILDDVERVVKGKENFIPTSSDN
jgi:hypothetical protein